MASPPGPAPAAFPAGPGRLLHRGDFYGVICSEQELCLWCSCSAPPTHGCRVSGIVSVQRSLAKKKHLWPKTTPCFFVLPLLSLEEQGALPAGAFRPSPLGSPSSLSGCLPRGKALVLPRSARAAEPRAVTRG